MKNHTKIKKLIATLIAALTLGGAAVFGGCNKTAARDGVDGKDLNIYDIYEAAKVESGNPDMTFTEFLRDYLSYNPDEIENAVTLQTSINRSLLSSVSIQTQFTENGVTAAYSGSGVIIDIDKTSGNMTVVTNCHVVYSAKSRRYSTDDGYSDNIHVWLYGSESDYEQTYKNNAISAKLVAASKTYDVAVLKVTGSDLVKKSQARAAEWSAAEEAYLGETVYAIGNANSQKLSANVGYISKDLELIQVDLGTTAKSEVYNYSVLRTSAAINSGNSGGGLYNLGGELSGLVNAKGKSDVSGMGYALTAASTKRAVQNLLDTYASAGGEVHCLRRVKHGITVTVADMYSTGLNTSGFAEIYEQVQITGVNYGSAASGKLESGDILRHIKITRGQRVIEDLDINREHNFHDAMLSVRSGDTVAITVLRGKEEVTQNLTFATFEEVY
ncbi:MAG: S1C family serine protease [Clostridiales bacterium]|nr:S1C family serine protease [Clostridiales bacterium]